MTKRQWSLLFLLITTGVGFVVDRLFFDEPAPAQAKPAGVASKPKPAVPGKTTPTTTVVATDPSLAWLERLADPHPGRDVFAPSPAWIKAQKEAVAKAKAQVEEKGPQPGSPEAFQAAHHLQATTVMERGGLAVVDGNCLNVGDVLEDFQLVRVTAGDVEFRRGRERAVLALPMGPGCTAKKRAAPAAKPAAPAAKSSGGTSLLQRLFGGK